MDLINTALFYIFFCSAVLIYGIGILPAVELSLSRKHYLLSAAKSCACVITTVVLTFLLKKFFLFPLSLAELYPLVALLIFIALSVFFEIVVQITAKKSSADFAVPYLAILLALDEGSTLFESIIISACALVSYYALIPVLQAFNNRMASQKNNDLFKQRICVFLCLVVLMFALYSLNFSWFNTGLLN